MMILENFVFKTLCQDFYVIKSQERMLCIKKGVESPTSKITKFGGNTHATLFYIMRHDLCNFLGFFTVILKDLDTV